MRADCGAHALVAKLAEQAPVHRGRTALAEADRRQHDALKPLSGVSDLGEVGKAFAVRALPACEGSLDQRVAAGEVRVEASLGHAERCCQRLNGHGADPAVCDRVERRAFPVAPTQSCLASHASQ